MRAQEVIKTIKWLKSVLDKTRFFAELQEGRTAQSTPDSFVRISSALYRLGKVIPIIERNTAAIEVLAAFNLTDLLTEEMGEVLMKESISGEGPAGHFRSFADLTYRWNRLIEFVVPLTTLTTPAELLEIEESEDIFSLQLRRAEGKELSLDELTKSMTYMQKLYDDLAKIYEKKEVGRLSLVKIESGSTVEINVKGSGEVVKELRKWFMEAWRMLRFRKPDRVFAHNEAVLHSLDALEKIEKAQIGEEEKTRLRKSLVGNTVHLLGLGVLPAEVEDEEMVNNVELIEGYTQKLLPAPTEKSESESSSEKTGAKKVEAKPKRKPRRKK